MIEFFTYSLYFLSVQLYRLRDNFRSWILSPFSGFPHLNTRLIEDDSGSVERAPLGLWTPRGKRSLTGEGATRGGPSWSVSQDVCRPRKPEGVAPLHNTKSLLVWPLSILLALLTPSLRPTLSHPLTGVRLPLRDSKRAFWRDSTSIDYGNVRLFPYEGRDPSQLPFTVLNTRVLYWHVPLPDRRLHRYPGHVPDLQRVTAYTGGIYRGPSLGSSLQATTTIVTCQLWSGRVDN